MLGPLQAVVKSQTLASHTTVDFITSVGLDNGVVKTVDFGYTSNHADGTQVQRVMKVPLLSIVPIPNLEVSAELLNISNNIQKVSTDKCASGGKGKGNGIQGGRGRREPE